MNSLPPATLLPATFPPRGLSRPLRVRVLRFLLLKWSPHDIAAECRVHPATVYRMARNLLQYGGIRAPAVRKLGRPRRLTTADEDAVLELLLSEGWRQQEEIVFWLWCERGVLTTSASEHSLSNVEEEEMDTKGAASDLVGT